MRHMLGQNETLTQLDCNNCRMTSECAVTPALGPWGNRIPRSRPRSQKASRPTRQSRQCCWSGIRSPRACRSYSTRSPPARCVSNTPTCVSNPPTCVCNTPARVSNTPTRVSNTRVSVSAHTRRPRHLHGPSSPHHVDISVYVDLFMLTYAVYVDHVGRPRPSSRWTTAASTSSSTCVCLTHQRVCPTQQHVCPTHQHMCPTHV